MYFKKEIKFDKFIDFFAEYYTKKVDKKQIIKGLSFLDKNKSIKLFLLFL